MANRNDFARWCTCGADHCVRVSWWSDETDETYMTIVDSLAKRGGPLWARARAAWRILTRAGVCDYNSAELLLDADGRRELAEFLVRRPDGRASSGS